MLISRVTRSTSPLSLILSFSKILIATFSPVIVCVPIRTLPNVPDPSDRPEHQIIVRLSKSCKVSFRRWTFIDFKLTDNVVSNCSILRLFCKLCWRFRWWSLLFVSFVFIVSCSTEAICIGDSEISFFLTFGWEHCVSWVRSGRRSSTCICYLVLCCSILWLPTGWWDSSSRSRVVRTCCATRSLWSMRSCPSLRNSQSSVLCIASIYKLLLVWRVKVLIYVHALVFLWA